MQRKVRVLFVCIGNSCRSQMAEGFARHKHTDVMEPLSAGAHPALIVQPETIAIMAEKGVSLEGQHAKPISSIPSSEVDLVVNMSGFPVIPLLPAFRGGNLVWAVTDPIGRSFEAYGTVRDRIEALVQELAENLRKSDSLPGV